MSYAHANRCGEGSKQLNTGTRADLQHEISIQVQAKKIGWLGGVAELWGQKYKETFQMINHLLAGKFKEMWRLGWGQKSL